MHQWIVFSLQVITHYLVFVFFLIKMHHLYLYIFLFCLEKKPGTDEPIWYPWTPYPFLIYHFFRLWVDDKRNDKTELFKILKCDAVGNLRLFTVAKVNIEQQNDLKQMSPVWAAQEVCRWLHTVLRGTDGWLQALSVSNLTHSQLWGTVSFCHCRQNNDNMSIHHCNPVNHFIKIDSCRSCFSVYARS